MTYLASKILPLFVYPLGLGIVLMLLGLTLLWRGRRVLAILLFTLAGAELWVTATPQFADALLGSLERGFPSTPVSTVPQAEAIVVLGGMVKPLSANGQQYDLTDAVDRLLLAARLFRAGRAPRLIVSGGAATYAVPEAKMMASFLVEIGIPGQVILLESKSRNTHQNAIFTKRLMQSHHLHKVLLVTSAYHMRRALATFRSAGIDALPVAADYRVSTSTNKLWQLNWLPNARALEKTTLAIKEYIGWFVYRLRGWIV